MAIMVTQEGTLSRTPPDTWVQAHNLVDRGHCDQLGEKIWQLVIPTGSGQNNTGMTSSDYISNAEKERLFP